MNREPSFFSVIPYPVLVSQDLKPNSKILYGIITSLATQKGYCYASNSYLAKIIGSSNGAVSRYVAELVDYGFLGSEYVKQGKETKERRLYVLGDSILQGGSSIRKGGSAERATGVVPYAQRDSNNKDNIKDNNALSRFNEFWSLYDKKVDRAKCERKWKRITGKQKDKIFEVLPNYIKQTPDKQYRKNPHTWLNGQCWEDEDIQKAEPDKPQARLYDGRTAKEWQDLGIELGVGEYEGRAVETFESYVKRVQESANG